MEFTTRFEEIAMAGGWENLRSPSIALTAWAQFVDSCAHCYTWSIYEFDNDMAVRDLIEQVLEDNSLVGTPELESFRREVEETDRRFRDLLRNDVQRDDVKGQWWRRGILSNGAGDYRTDIRQRYGILISECS